MAAVEALVAAVKKLQLASGLPPLGTRVASRPGPIENRGHATAELRVHEFVPLRRNPLDPSHPSILWNIHGAGEMATWGSDGDVKRLVARALNDVINATGLAGVLKCYKELHFDCQRADVWVVRERSGVPVGVVEVKRPGTSFSSAPQNQDIW